MNHNSLCLVLTFTLCLININVVNKLVNEWCCDSIHIKKLSYCTDKHILAVLYCLHICYLLSQVKYLDFQLCSLNLIFMGHMGKPFIRNLTRSIVLIQLLIKRSNCLLTDYGFLQFTLKIFLLIIEILVGFLLKDFCKKFFILLKHYCKAF